MHGTVRLSLDFYTPVNEVLLEDSFVKTPLKYLIFICIVLSLVTYRKLLLHKDS